MENGVCLVEKIKSQAKDNKNREGIVLAHAPLNQAQTCLTKAMAPVQRRKEESATVSGFCPSSTHPSMLPPMIESVGTQTQ